MNRTSKNGLPWIIGLLTCLAASAQTPASTNTAADQAPQWMDTNAVAVTNTPGWSSLTNQSAAQINLSNLLGVIPSQPPLLGPGTVGSYQAESPLTGTRAFAIPPGATGGAIPIGPGIPIWGPIALHPSLSYAFAYASSVESQPGQRTDSILQTISAGFLFDLGTHWVLDYAPSYEMYSGGGFQDTLAHSLSLRGGTTYGDWALSLQQSYFSSSELLLETGTQTAQEEYQTSLGASYQMGSKLALQLSADQSIRDTTLFNNVTSWSGGVGLNYAVTPQLKTGISLAAGYNDISLGSSMPFESVQGTVTFQPREKLSLGVSGGVEDLQFVHPTAPSLITPIFSAFLQYHIFPDTTISLSGSRSVNPSFFGNQVQITTEVGGSIAQVLSKKWTISLNAGYVTEPLTAIVPQALPQFFLGTPPNTTLVEDETMNSASVGLTVNYAVMQRLSLSAYCTLNQTTSSQSNFKDSSTQVGFSVNYRY